MKPRSSPLPRSSKPLKRTPLKKRPRKPSEFRRIYGSKERVEWVKSLPCCACGSEGYAENAHVPPKGEAGTGYKAHYTFIAPLCGLRSGFIVGCHRVLHDLGRESFEKEYHVNLDRKADETERAWLLYSGQEEEKRAGQVPDLLGKKLRKSTTTAKATT